VRVMARRAAFPKRRVLEREKPGLLPVALPAGFVHAGHHQTPSALEDVAAVRIVALGAVQFPLHHRVVLWQLKFRLRLPMALEALPRILPGIQDVLPPSAPSGYVETAGPVTGFAASLTRAVPRIEVDSGMSAPRKVPRDVPVALRARRVSHEAGPGDHGGHDQRPRRRRT